MTKLGAVIQVPFRSGNQFLGEGGLQVSRTVKSYRTCAYTGGRTFTITFATRLVLSPTNIQTWVEQLTARLCSISKNCVLKSKHISRFVVYVVDTAYHPPDSPYRIFRTILGNSQHLLQKNVNSPRSLSATLAQISLS